MKIALTKLTRLITTRLAVLALLMLFVVGSCNQAEEEIAPAQDLPEVTDALEAFDEEVEYVEYLANSEDNARWGHRRWKRKPTFFTLVSALHYTGLLRTVIKEKLTIFAPDDKAFAKLGLNFWNIRYKLDRETLTAVLLNHVAGGFVFSRDLDCSLQTAGNTTLRVIEAGKGLVLQDDSDKVANFLFTDRRALRSVFHGIDKVLDLQMPSGTIADIAVGIATGDNPEFTQLVEALIKAGLVGAVANPDGNLTVFAPVDQAFQNLYDALDGVNGIEDLSVDILTRVLTHHVVGARVFSNCLENGEVQTLNLNENLLINVDNLTITSSAGVVANLVVGEGTLDIKASNGVIHVIDAVLVPSNYLDPLP